MYEKNAKPARAEKTGICHIILGAFLLDLTSHNPRDARDEQNSESKDDVLLAGTEQAHKNKRKKNARKR